MAQNHNSSRTGLMAEYNAADTVVTINGKSFWGFGEDTMFTVSWDNDNYSTSQDPQGTAVGSTNNKTGATITINLSEASPMTNELIKLSDTRANFPIDLVSTTTHGSGAHCHIVKHPDFTAAATASNRAWQIKALNFDEESLMTSIDD